MTKNKKLRIPDYISHIPEAIVRIEGYLKGFDQNLFVSRALGPDAVIRKIEIIGEATNSIRAVDGDFARGYPDLRLEQAY